MSAERWASRSMNAGGRVEKSGIALTSSFVNTSDGSSATRGKLFRPASKP